MHNSNEKKGKSHGGLHIKLSIDIQKMERSPGHQGKEGPGTAEMAVSEREKESELLTNSISASKMGYFASFLQGKRNSFPGC